MTQSTARCSIYEDRPQMCRDYPTVKSYMPPECTFSFPSESERSGECACGVGACCSLPRAGGEPEAAYLPDHLGGEPCKHLIWVSGEEEKTASPGVEIAEQTKTASHHLLKVLGHVD